MYKGTIKWQDEFDGEQSENVYQVVDSNPRAIITAMLFYLNPNDRLISFTIESE
jgi:hypothetical protein